MFYSTATENQTQNAENGWTASHLLQLKSGCNSLNPASGQPSGWGPVGFAGPYTELQQEEMRKCWESCGDEIMDDYRSHRPGQRPWFWWKLRGSDLPEDELQTLMHMDEIQRWDEADNDGR